MFLRSLTNLLCAFYKYICRTAVVLLLFFFISLCSTTIFFPFHCSLYVDSCHFWVVCFGRWFLFNVAKMTCVVPCQWTTLKAFLMFTFKCPRITTLFKPPSRQTILRGAHLHTFHSPFATTLFGFFLPFCRYNIL